jgi:PKD repeat protein
MKYLRYFCLLMAVTLMGGSLMAQKDLDALMRERNEYYFTLTVDKPTEVQTINEICSVDGFDGKTVVCYANQQQYDKLLQAGYQPKLQTPPCMLEETAMWDGSNRAAYGWDSYPTYGAYQSMMEAFPSQALSDRSCTLLDLGTLNSGRKILGVRLNNGQPDGKPRFLYTSTMHGDEVTGMMLMLRLIDEFCTSTDPRIVNLLNNLDIFIFPLTNPDGTYYGGNNSMNQARRYNINGVDLNRNYKDYFKGNHPDGNAYALETQWTMQLANEYLFTMSANYHGGAEVVNYPWDAVYDDHADKDWYELVSLDYVSRVREVSSSYMTSPYSSGITNGAEWYIITGSRQDYENAYGECREVTIECSSTKKPNASTMPTYWNYNHNAMLGFMEQCLNGIHGVVYDAATNQPIVGATVNVQNHDNNLSKVTTHNVGDFHRPIKGGSYTLEINKEGYCPAFVDVSVSDGQRVDLDTIYLEPGNCMVPSFTASATEVALGQSISFTDHSFGVISSWNWNFEGATPATSTSQNPTGITYNSAGTYNVTLTITDAQGNSETLTKENYIHVAASYNMLNGTFSTCDALFYDFGGPNSNYSNNLSQTMTFMPSTPGAKISVTFSEFNTEANYDFLYIYDGTSTSATQIGKYSGTTSPGTVVATNEDGALTFMFTSDYSVNKSGWVATVDCIVSTVEQTVPLSVGWNWWSSYIELSDIDGLGQLENGIGVPNALIQSQNDGYVKSGLRNGRVVWRGELTSINNEEMYKIGTKTACNATVVGFVTTPSEHPITINRGWNWIGFPCSQSVSVDVAMSGFTPRNNDVIKGIHSYATYSNGTWSGTLNTLEPGQGYMYGTKNNTPKTLVFQTGRGDVANPNITPENNYFQPVADYADNMTLTAVVEIEGKELRSEDYELAAFVGDECRGSVKLMYVEPVDRYIAFLTVFGDEEENLSFRLTDGVASGISTDLLTYAVDGIVGELDNPVVLHFGPIDVEENASVNVRIYPNPSEGIFNIEGSNIKRVEVFNALGQPVCTMETDSSLLKLDLTSHASGIYLIRVITSDGIKSHQVMKR